MRKKNVLKSPRRPFGRFCVFDACIKEVGCCQRGLVEVAGVQCLREAGGCQSGLVVVAVEWQAAYSRSTTHNDHSSKPEGGRECERFGVCVWGDSEKGVTSVGDRVRERERWDYDFTCSFRERERELRAESDRERETLPLGGLRSGDEEDWRVFLRSPLDTPDTVFPAVRSRWAQGNIEGQ